MATQQRTSGAGELVRNVVGVVLFVVWVILTVLWVGSIIYAFGTPAGGGGALVKAIVAILLLLLLAGMEGLEVAVIDRWSQLFPDRPQSELAGWLAARQLFVALIVTTATILAEPAAVPVLVTDYVIGLHEDEALLKTFTIAWTTITVLWYMQILPKHMAATNPDRYLARTRSTLFPIVQVVHHLGVAKPAETVAKIVENRLDWHEPEGVQLEARRPAPQPGNVASAWAALIPERAPSSSQPRRDGQGTDA